MAAYVYRSIPQKVLLIMPSRLFPFLQWLDAVITTLTGGGSAAPAWTPVRLVTAASLNAYTYSSAAQTITFNAFGSQTVDGAATVLADRILNLNGAAAADQGIFGVTTKGTGSVYEVWTRTADANASAQFLPGRLIESGPDGAANNNNIYELTSAAPFTLDTTAVTFAAPTNVMSTNTAQTVTALKSFAQLMLGVWNAGKTFAAKFTFAGTATRTVTIPDASFTMAQSGATPTGSTGTPSATSAPAFTGTAQSLTDYATYVSPTPETTAGGATLVVNANLANSAATIGAQPAVPCKLNLIITDANSSCSGTIACVGVGAAGDAINETITVTAQGSHTYVSANAFLRITSITPNITGIDVGTDKLAVGQSSAIGLQIPVGATSVVVNAEAVGATPASVPVSDTIGTVDTTARTIIPNTASNGVKAQWFWFSYQLTPAGTVAAVPTAAHTHTAGTLTQV